MKKIVCIFLALISLVTLCSCSTLVEAAKSLQTVLNAKFDPAEYLRGCMEVSYHAVITEEYLAMVDDPVTEEEAKAQYEEDLEYIADQFATAYEFYYPTEEQLQRIREIYNTLFQNIKYEIGEVSETSDGNYLVSMTIHPIDVMVNTVNGEPGDKFYDEFSEMTGSFYEQENPDEEKLLEYEAYWADGILDCVEAGLSDIGYLEPVTMSVQIENTDGLYAINEDDWYRIDELLIAY